jgi:polysaccharide biosynthesis/export protein
MMRLSAKKKLLILNTLVILFIAAMPGCIPQKETVYLQDHSARKNYENPYGTLEVITEKYILRPNDGLYIQVKTANPQLSQYFSPGTTTGMGTTGQSASLFTYPIDDNHDIDFPFVGKINLKGCTRTEAKGRIAEALEPFLSDAQVTVRLANPYFIALGETGEGRIDMGKEQVTIYEAIALSGGIKTFGKKRQVKIVRPMGNTSHTFYVDLTDKNLVDSDHYYIYPNDLIYIRPMRARTWGIGESFSYGILTSTIGLYFVLNSLFN